MNKKQLEYFMETYHYRNIQVAADNLYISHQGLSRVIRSLEDELGQALFVRSNRGLEPTDFATTLLPHIQSLLDTYARIEGVQTLAGQEKSVVTVYALDHVLGYLGAEFILRFHEEHPDITLSVVDTTDELALNSLSSCHADFAIVNGPIDNTRFNCEELFYSRYCYRIHCRRQGYDRNGQCRIQLYTPYLPALSRSCTASSLMLVGISSTAPSIFCCSCGLPGFHVIQSFPCR